MPRARASSALSPKTRPPPCRSGAGGVKPMAIRASLKRPLPLAGWGVPDIAGLCATVPCSSSTCSHSRQSTLADDCARTSKRARCHA